MQCQDKTCDVSLPIILSEIKTKDKQIVYCLNHTLMHLPEIRNELLHAELFEDECECCGAVGTCKINYGQDGVMTLCVEDVIDLLCLNLKPERFLNLFAKHPLQHILHDDFYDMDGQAMQPRDIKFE